ncbi:MAG: zinc-ribbon domain-containing protein [Kiritimatiellaeota bacterium]|nr:zinc-ribbon domain-containing protein [Kiritimatiellota bacterium]
MSGKISCPQCGQELKEGTKFCTSCGAKFKTNGTVTRTLPIISIVLSTIGIVGQWWCWPNFGLDYYLFCLLQPVGIIIALIAQNKQQKWLGLLAGVLPCANLIVFYVYIYLRFYMR